MSIRDIIVSNFFTLTLCAGLGALVLTNQTFEKRTARLFMMFVLTVFVLDLAEMADYYLAFAPGFSRWRYVTSALGYALRPAALAIILFIVLRKRSLRKWILLPLALNAVISLTSIFTHWMFWFTAQNEFCRGALGYLPHVLSGFYMLLLVIMSIRYFSTIGRGEIFIICYAALICAAASFLESVLAYRFLLVGGMCISCTLYFTFLYVQTYKRDELTGVLNRRSFYWDTERMQYDSSTLISADLNDLKGINDSHGHAAGDAALQTLANVLTVTAGKSFRVYRTGGDEFMIWGPQKNLAEARQYIDKTQIALQKTGYMASFGCAEYIRGAAFDAACNLADAQMYQDKRRYKYRSDSRGTQSTPDSDRS